MADPVLGQRAFQMVADDKARAVRIREDDEPARLGGEAQEELLPVVAVGVVLL